MKTSTPVKQPERHASKTHSSPTRDVRLHGRHFTGTVTSDKMTKTATVAFSRRRLNKKYERYERVWTRIKAHNPVGIDARTGDVVHIVETRPLSKTKHFVIVEIIKKA